MKALTTLGYVLALPILLVLVWWASTLGAVNFFVPTPATLVGKFGEVWFGPRFLSDVLPSVGRLLLGVTAAIVIGVVGGVLIGSVRWLRALLEPVLEFFRAIPPPVLVPVLILVMGVTDPMKVAVIISGCVWPVLLNTIEGVRAVDGVLSDSAHTYGISGWARVRYLVLPSASPQIMAGVRQSLSLGLILMVISEMFASSSGLGFTIVQFQRSFAIPEMWSGIVVLGLLGVALSFIFQWAERNILRWYHGQKEVENAA
ncbi:MULTISPECIES: ABC transporter permease [unclassified Pseudarthrobacter]|uniref:ABC transporter permease n=1 Tax=unclassified Pseudarthrobacter TaxID=2647000 RepID=UPI001629E4AE|nr:MULTISPECIES: ABC transporter permease [unclassified Pseudarthrobacter]MBE4719092.1 nitrate ABC transporter permease [Pseudarthrobacter sp. AB1]QNE15504.1 ABC transporter permease [Pseudarthrobacter sp. NBSH8]